METKLYKNKGLASAANKRSHNGACKIVAVEGGFILRKPYAKEKITWRQVTAKRGGVVARVWDYFDANAGKYASRKELLDAGVKKGFATNTLRTQFTQWEKARVNNGAVA